MNSRHLTVVMFTDIEGYTRLMQTDELAAMELRARHREVFEASHEKFNGTVIQYFGDGTLSTFKSSKDAVDCAIEMQAAFKDKPKVPLRIGIHLGDIISTKDGIAGDAVNVAARVESLGVSGSILVSSKIYDDIKNQRGIKTESMGFFEFKNVDKAKEVFAIANRGLVVPEPESLVGKTKPKKDRKTSPRNLGGILKELWNRKVFLVAAAYLLGLWLLLKAAAYVVSYYAISPYWPDVLLVFFISFLPSVILHSYYHNRLELRHMRTVEKITIPSNTILSVALLVFLFGGKDLGAMTRMVSSTDEFGKRIEEEIVKDEFRKKIYGYSFTNETGDSMLNWLGYGITELIGCDLLQESFFWNRGYWEFNTLGEKLAHAQSEYAHYIITGKFKKKDNLYVLTSHLYDAEKGRLIQERHFDGANLFALADKMSQQLKADVGMPVYYIQKGKDLPISSILTDNLEAYKFYINAVISKYDFERLSYYRKADQLDPTFATSNYYCAEFLNSNQISHAASEEAINKAMEHRANTSNFFNMRIRTLYYKIHGHTDKAIALREMQADLNPTSTDAFNHLYKEYFNNNKYGKALVTCEKLHELFPELSYLKETQAQLLKLLNRPKKALEIMNDYVTQFPRDINGFLRLGDIHLALGNLDEAQSIFNKVSLMNPEHKGAPMMLDHIHYLKKTGVGYIPEMQKSFVGEYRASFSEKAISYTYLDNKLMAQVKNRRPYQIYPVNDSSYVSLSGKMIAFIKNGAGNFYKQIHTVGEQASTYYSKDSTILKAEKLLEEGRNEAALAAYKAAYAQNPNHHFLDNYIKHLEFKLGNHSKPLASIWENVTGTYYTTGNNNKRDIDRRTVSLKNDELEWSRPDGIQFRLLPMNEKSFLVLGRWEATVIIHGAQGKNPTLEWVYDSRITIRTKTSYIYEKAD